jgi:hypothetical protein
MTSSFHQLNEGPIAPRELLVLKIERFVDDPVPGRVASPLIHTRLPTGTSVESVLAVAFLSNEQVGGIQLKLVRKRVAGLVPITVLVAVPVDVTIRWPQFSLESRVHLFAELSKDGFRSNEVSAIIFDWLGKNHSNPDQAALGLIKGGLVTRGLMKKAKSKRLGLFTTRRYEVTHTTTKLLDYQNIESVYQLLDECQSTRPQVWEALVKGIGAGLERRHMSG